MTVTRRERFFEYFAQQLARIELLDAAELKIHKKMLYVALIDALAGVVYPASGNRERFTAVVRQFGGWADSERISVPHLARALRLNPDPAYNTIREKVQKELSSWSNGDLIPITRDIEAGIVGTHWPKDKHLANPVTGTPWAHLKHLELLYSYRNALVHGFRPLGSDFEFTDDDAPFYISTYTMKAQGTFAEVDYWDLIYPSNFFRTLATSVLSGVKAHIEQIEADPIEVLKGGKYWVQALNQ